MADISKIRLGNQGGTYTEYNIKDAAARQAAVDLDERVDEIEEGTYSKTEVDNKLATYAKKDGGVALASSAEKLLGEPKAVEFGGQGLPTTAEGVALIKEVNGRSIVWNQILANGNFESTTGWLGITSLSGGVATSYKAGTGSSGYQDIARSVALSVTVGHVYLLAASLVSNNANTAIRIQVTNTASVGGSASRYRPTWEWVGYIWTASVASILPRVRGTNSAGTDIDFSAKEYCIYDLTKIFGAGNEPATVEEFQALYNSPYYGYNAGEIMSNKTEYLGIYTGSDMERLDLNLATLTGKLNASGQSVTIFPNGMRSAGSVYDTLVADADGYARRAIVRTGVRAYESGDDTNPAVVTDGESTIYALATPQIYVLDTPLLLIMRTYKGGSIIQNPATPYDTAPMSMEVALPLDMPQSYIGEDSMDDFLAALGTAMGGTWSKTYNTSTGKWEFNFASN